MARHYYWLNEDSRRFLSKGYLKENQTAEERLEEIATNAEKILKIDGFADKFLDYLSKGYYSLSTPVWVNFGNTRGLPVSCFGSYIPDTIRGILRKNAEVGMMTKFGGGTSGYFGDIRPRGSSISVGGTADGPVHFMELFEQLIGNITQGNARRGSFAAYLPIEHPDILEFLKIRDDGNRIQQMSIGVTITNKWLEEMKSGDKNKRKIWAKLIEKRYSSGYPYIQFIDNCNDNKPQVYKDKDMKILHSNLCAEISLPDTEDESFVCVLSSINLYHWDEIKNTDAVETMTYFLEAVNEEFVRKTEGDVEMSAPHNFAKNHRALGIGVLGWHSYLQKNMIAFESMEAKFANTSIFKTIKEKSYNASAEMAKLYGETELLKGYGMRNATTMAVAPTTSSSFILGQISPGIEPLADNYFVKDLAKGTFSYKNPEFINLLNNKYPEYNNSVVWRDILKHGGSVQHLKFLTDHEKAVFKTFGEISQREVIIQASARQPYIDQGQSVNIMIGPKVPGKEVTKLMLEAAELGVKSLYYQRSANPAQELSRSINTCVSCEG